MNDVNKTLYIPLYSKAYVSRKGLFLDDKKAEQIWEKEGFRLKRKSKSRWLAYYIGMRAAVFDSWLIQKMTTMKDAVVINIGCGMDGRVQRVGTMNHPWYDVDFQEVIEKRKRYYQESVDYKMIAGDVRQSNWLTNIPQKKSAIVIMEGLSMYLTSTELRVLMKDLSNHFKQLAFMMDCYTILAARISKFKNPVNDIGVTKVYGLDNPKLLETDDFIFVKEHDMTPQNLIDKLTGIEKCIFKRLYAGNFSKRLYRLLEYRRIQID